MRNVNGVLTVAVTLFDPWDSPGRFNPLCRRISNHKIAREPSARRGAETVCSLEPVTDCFGMTKVRIPKGVPSVVVVFAEYDPHTPGRQPFGDLALRFRFCPRDLS